MLTKSFDNLPDVMRTPQVMEYYASLDKKRGSLAAKRVIDVLFSLLLLIALSPVLLVTALAIKLDSKGPVFYRQPRVTQNMREFRILKFRSMVDNADKKGPLVTIDNDSRITRMGKLLRRTRLDEIPQLINVLAGDMSFVGTRPEVKKYVDRYQPEMYATLLLPAGVTSEASIRFKDEAEMLKNADNVDDIYADRILPVKMSYNLEYIKEFTVGRDVATMWRTVFAVM